MAFKAKFIALAAVLAVVMYFQMCVDYKSMIPSEGEEAAPEGETELPPSESLESLSPSSDVP